MTNLAGPLGRPERSESDQICGFRPRDPYRSANPGARCAKACPQHYETRGRIGATTRPRNRLSNNDAGNLDRFKELWKGLRILKELHNLAKHGDADTGAASS